jgi:hypothetical protein
MTSIYLAIYLEDDAICRRVDGNDLQDALKGAEKQARSILLNGIIDRKKGRTVLYPAHRIRYIAITDAAIVAAIAEPEIPEVAVMPEPPAPPPEASPPLPKRSFLASLFLRG